MKLYKRAVLFLLRKRGKAIILLFILTVIASLVLTSLSIARASDLAAEKLRESLGGYFKIEPNRDGGQVGYINDALVQKVMQQGGIKVFNGMDIQYLMTNGLQLTPGRFTSQGDPKAHLARFLANTDSSFHEYFYLKSFSLSEGRQIGPDDHFAAVISDTLARDNQLSVGGTFAASFNTESLPESMKKTNKQYEFTVVGIYKINSEQTSDSNSAECDIQDNFIFTDTSSIRSMMADLSGSTTTAFTNGATFFVKDPGKLDQIVKSLPSIPGYDWSGYKISENNKAYDDSAVPLERLSGLLITLTIVIVVVSAAMLSLILVMWMKDRKYEIGILLSVGYGKMNIIAQHIAENLLVAILAFLLAWGVSGIAAQQAGSMLLGNITAASDTAEDKQTSPQMYIDPVKAPEINPEEALTIRTGVTEFLLIVGIGFLIVIVSTGISSIMVIRMKPKEIFSSLS
ncbi:MacB-like core domain-containing protein [Sporobacter termitidis DSM 10068]|uniref:MacB-like core domain-containing protein n=1 Tax=Sporobacter termitidis DSM 10068 TaxID=1123282 RepID=A0A1M5W4H8_9FIRM|nr:ABC transporter permease [Sporobacter termitidis]SHH82348.1 MacB-like core domain-containing protein [Sporobacter termitidis DSM 10068]